MMTCDRFNELLADAIDQALPSGEADGFRQHAEACEACGVAMAAYRRVIALAAEADFDVEDVIEPVSKDMSIGAIHRALHGRRVRPRWIRKPLWRLGIGRYT